MRKSSYLVSWLCLALCLVAPLVGGEDPPGPPGSRESEMPSLAEIEPRHLINSLPHTITNSGPYVVTRNLKVESASDGITINADFVTLDLNGFTIEGDTGAKNGINVPSDHSFIIIRNGVIENWPDRGIEASLAQNSRMVDLLVRSNGTHGITLGINGSVARCSSINNQNGYGFDLGANSTVSDSRAVGNGNTGFRARTGSVLRNCIAIQNSNGFYVDDLAEISFSTAADNDNSGFCLGPCCSVGDCAALGNIKGFDGYVNGIVYSRCVAYSNQYGFYTGNGSTLSHCSANVNSMAGILTANGCSVFNCTAVDNKLGIWTLNASTVTKCSAGWNADAGIQVGEACSVDGCTVISSTGTNIVAGAGSDIRNNVCRNSVVGLSATDACRVRDNHFHWCSTGIQISGTKNLLSGNTLLENTSDYNIGAGNRLDILVSELPMDVPWPAKLTLAGTLEGEAFRDGISITASNVTVDLNGHALVGLPNAYSGIAVAGSGLNVEIRNGTIQGWGGSGVNAGSANGIKLAGVQCHTNSTHGAILGHGAVIRSCVFSENGSNGLQTGRRATLSDCTFTGNDGDGLVVGDAASVKDCVFTGNNGDGLDTDIGAAVLDCSSMANGARGIYAHQDVAIRGCTVNGNTGNGIEMGTGCAVERCTVDDNDGNGIQAQHETCIRDNTCDGNALSGIYVYGSDSTVEGNHTVNCGVGIRVANGNMVVRNRSAYNTTNYDIGASAIYGPVHSGTGEITEQNPWTNFEF